MNIRKFKWILAFAGAVVVVLLLRGFAFTSCLIPSTGMENSIFQGERILVNKWSYGLRVPFMSLFSYHRWCESPVRRQDIVVFNNPAGIRDIKIVFCTIISNLHFSLGWLMYCLELKF